MDSGAVRPVNGRPRTARCGIDPTTRGSVGCAGASRMGPRARGSAARALAQACGLLDCEGVWLGRLCGHVGLGMQVQGEGAQAQQRWRLRPMSVISRGGGGHSMGSSQSDCGLNQRERNIDA